MSTQPRLRPRWYIVAAFGWFILLGLIIVTIALLDAYYILRMERAYFDPLPITFILLMVIAFAWTCWVVPILSASDIPKHTKHPPSQRRASLVMFTLAPGLTLMCLAIAFACIRFREHGWAREQNRAAFCFTLGLFLTFVGLVMACVAIHRLRQASAQCGICYACGYDLRASPNNTCSDCGFRSEPVHDEAQKSLAEQS